MKSGSVIRTSYVSTPCPVVICTYLCTSEFGTKEAMKSGLKLPSSMKDKPVPVQVVAAPVSFSYGLVPLLVRALLLLICLTSIVTNCVSFLALWKNTPLERQASGRMSFQSTESGVGEQFLLLDCMTKVQGQGTVLSQTPIATRVDICSPDAGAD